MTKRCAIPWLIAIINSIFSITGNCAVIEQSFSFPPVENGSSSGAIVSIVGLALGPWNSQEMQSKIGPSERKLKEGTVEKGKDYVIAIHLIAVASWPPPNGNIFFGDSIKRVINADGFKEEPSGMTPVGFVTSGKTWLRIEKTSKLDGWAFFPVAADQTDFLFEFGVGSPQVLRVVLKGGKLSLTKVSNAAPAPDSKKIENVFSIKKGIEGDSRIRLSFSGGEITGSAIGQKESEANTFSGRYGSAGSYELAEMNQKKEKVGVYKGRLSGDFRSLKGYFATPDGSTLLPFSAAVYEAPKPAGVR